MVDQVIKLVHLEDLVFLSDFKLSDFLAVAIDLRIDSDLFLVQDRLLRLQVLVLAVHFRFVFLAFDQFDLVGDPVFLDVSGLLINFLDLLLDVVSQVFGGAHELVAVATSLQVRTLTVQRVHLQGLLLNAKKALLDVFLNLLNIVLFLFELSFEIVEFFLEDLVLGGCVQVVKADARDLV